MAAPPVPVELELAFSVTVPPPTGPVNVPPSFAVLPPALPVKCAIGRVQVELEAVLEGFTTSGLEPQLLPLSATPRLPADAPVVVEPAKYAK